MKKTGVGKIILVFFTGLLLTGAIVLTILFVSKLAEYQAKNDMIQDVAKQVFQSQDDSGNTGSTEISNLTGEEESLGEDHYDYSVLKDINEECIGWIRIDGTGIDLPVMWRQYNNTFYLKRDLYKQYATHGTPFLDGSTTPQGQLIIHGHNMSDGHCFASLINYKNKEFYDAHPIITLYLYEEKLTFEIFAVCSFNSMIDYMPYEIPISDYPEKVKTYIEEMKERSIYDTEVGVVPEERILVLSTCEYSHSNGRMVVVAHQITTVEEN